MGSMFDIDKAAQEYGRAHDALRDIMAELDDDIRKIKDGRMRRVRDAVQRTAEKRVVLEDLIDESRDLFGKPRTRILHGVKVGIEKGKGKIEIDDADITIRLIRRHFPDRAETLIRTSESVIKAALAELPAADLKRIGARVEETGDQVVIRPTDSEIDKLVDALLKEREEPEAA